MADRGDVVQLKRRLGFQGDREGERVIVVQSSPLNGALPTTMVVPLDSASGPLRRQRYVVRVSASEAGASDPCVAIATHIMTVRTDRLAPGIVGRLRPSTLAGLDALLRLVLEL